MSQGTVPRPTRERRCHGGLCQALGRALFAVCAAGAAVLAGAPSANAQCVQVGSTVTCTGTDADGFVATDDGLTVDVVTGAIVEDGGVAGTSAIGALDESEVTVFAGGEVNASGDGSTAVSGGDATTIVSDGAITSSGANGIGLSIAENAGIGNDGTVAVTGAGGVGVQLGDGSILFNRDTAVITSDLGLAVRGDAGANRVDNFGGATLNGAVDLLGGDDRFVSYSGSTIVGTIDGGDGEDTLDLASGNALADTFDLDVVQGFETFNVNGTNAQDWTLSGSATFANGSTVNSGNVRFAPGAALGGEFSIEGGQVVVNVPVSFADGFSVDGGDATIDTGGDVTGGARVSSGTLEVRDVVRNGLTATGGTTQFQDGARVFGGASIDGGFATLTGATTFQGGLSLTSGSVVFDGANVTGGVSVDGGTATLRDAVSLSEGLALSGGRAVLEPGAALAGDVDVDGGTLALDGDATMQGDLTQTGGSTFESQLDPDGSSFQLDVTGSAAIGDATLTLRRSGSEDFDAAQAYTVLTATEGIDGEFDDIALEGAGTGFLAARATYGPAVGPSAVQVVAGISYEAPARSANQQAVGSHLDAAAQGATSPEFQSYLDSLKELDTTAAISALDALHAEIYDAHTSAAFATASAFTELLAGRPIRCERYVSPYRPNQASYPPCSKRGVVGWATGFGRYAKRDGRPGFTDWTYGGGGLAVGGDYRLGDAFLVSGMLGSSRMALGFDGNGDGSMTTLDFGGAVAWQQDGAHVRGVFEYGHGWHDTRRQVDYPGFYQLNTSDHDSDRITLAVEGGYEFRFGAIDVEPIASLEYSWLREDSTSESKKNVTALSIGSRENVLVTGDAGVRVGATIVKYGYFGDLLEWADGVWRPEVTVRWRQVFNDYDRASSARLRAAPAGTPRFRSKSEDAQYGGEFGAGVSFQPHGTRNTVHLGYDAFVGDRTQVHTLMGTVRIPF